MKVHAIAGVDAQCVEAPTTNNPWDAPEARLLPYLGDRAFEHFGTSGAPHSTPVYASDRSGTKTYHFNSDGFRGESLKQDAALRVFVCGASYALGTGLNWHETWSYHLKGGLADALRLDPTRVNVLNFSQSLASANYITRTLLGQCAALAPDLVVANYSDMNRAEYFLDGSPVGAVPFPFPWHRRLRILRAGWRQRLIRMLPGLRDRTEANRRLAMWDAYARLYTPELGILNTVTNILLLQAFCRTRGIDCLVSFVQYEKLSEPRFAENPVLAPLIRLIDRQSFCPFSIVDAEICTDLAADGIHPGSVANKAFADRLVRMYVERCDGQGQPQGRIKQ